MTFGGESYLDVRKRMTKTIRKILDTSDASTILIVSHGAAIAQFYRSILTDYPRVGMRNCAILTFHYAQGNFELLSIVDPVNQEMLYEKED